ncbi:MAG: hypothetical protein ACTSVM_07075 [Candidatus Ranarchaeia archaeon]
MAPKKSRPLGVTIIAIIVAIAAIFTILGGLGLLGFGILLGFGGGIPGLGALTGIIGILTLLWGLVGFYVAKGLWSLEKWAWTWSILWLILDLILNLLGGSMPTVVIAGITLIYLYLKRDAFR